MTKQELMENYTIEQLADMIIDLERELSAKDTMLRTRLSKCVLSEDGDALQVTCDKCGEKSIAFLEDKYILITKEKCDEMNEEIKKQRLCNDAKVSLTTEGWKCKCEGLHIAREENERMKKEVFDMKAQIEELRHHLERKATEIEQIDDILNELFGVKHDVAKPNKFKEILKEKLKGNVGSDGYCEKQKKTNNFYGIYANSAKNLTKDDILIFLGILTKELVENGIDFRYDMENEMKVYDITVKDDKTIADFLPAEPIEVAEFLISAKQSYDCSLLQKKIFGMEKSYYHIYNISELRQIAEHLLVYCNAQKENGDE